MTVPTQISAVTQCPHCSAKFRVRPEQVKLHAGLVRCGACRGIFDAVEHLIEGTLPSFDPIDDEGEAAPPQTIIQGMPAMQQEVEPPEAAAFTWHARASEDSTPTQEHVVSTPDDSVVVRNVDADEPQQDDSVVAAPGTLSSYRWRPPPQTSSRAVRWVFAALSVLAALGLVAQATFFFRDEIASRVPQLAPSLTAACTFLDCRLAPPKRGESLGFVGTDLAADPAHRGLLIFTATLRNSGSTAVAYPHLILSLDGLGGELVVRRVFTPAEFAPATASLARGLEAGAEIEVKLYLDASQTNVLGFKVDHAYL
jgi:predicted Zn finger-like uncharacterized protein